MTKYFTPLLIFCGLILFFASCEDDFDEPPVDELIELSSNTTIAELKAMHTLGAEDSEITSDVVIEGVVVSDDREGNFFESLVIQDATGGIALRLEQGDLYTEYPVGRRVFVKAQGLYIGDFNGSHQLNGSPGSNIQTNLIANFLVKGELNQDIVPQVVRITDINASMINTLLEFENVEVAPISLGQSYADAVNNRAENRTIRDCSGNDVIMRTSGFSDFASASLPRGNGSLTAVLGIFNINGTVEPEDFQLTIRDTTDLAFTGSRCDGSGGGGTSATLQSIADVRAQFGGGVGAVSADTKISGIVISDRANNNITGRNIVIQDETGGIIARFDGNHPYNLGDELEIVVSSVELSEFNGLLQVNNVPLGNVEILSNNNSVTPAEVTVSDISNNFESLESTLVLIKDATISGSVTYNGVTTISDATSSIDMFTRGDATFSEANVPSGLVDITAIVSEFNAPQIAIRNLDDVVVTDPDGGGGSGETGNESSVSIEDIRSQFNSGSGMATAETKISGIVISDRANGNITDRNLVVQDGDFGIVLRYTEAHSYELGDEIEVIVSNLELSEFNGLLQVNNIPITNTTVLNMGQSVTPRTVDVQTILNNQEIYESTLVSIEGATISGNNIYNGSTQVTDASATVEMFTRSGASFANDNVPTETVTITAIVSEFNETNLSIRNLDDIEVTGMSGGGGEEGEEGFVDISDVRNLFSGSATTVSADSKIKGVVISDFENGNITGRNLVLQEGASGIVLRFDGNHSFALGDELEVSVSNLELSEFNGLLQVNNVPLSNAMVISSSNMITPTVVTVSDIQGNVEMYESTLVTINDAEITGSTTYNGSTTITDASGSLDMFTRGSASFSDASIPENIVNITGIVGEFNSPQLSIRNLNDVEDTGMSGGGGEMGEESLVSLENIRSQFTGTDTNVSDMTMVKAVVISDSGNGNINARNAIVQDGMFGIVIRFTEDHSFAVGDELDVSISGLELSEFNGLLQINNVPLANATVVSSGNSASIREATVKMILDNAEMYESTLVKIMDVTISGSDTYAGTTTVDDGTDQIDMFTRNGASFADMALPSTTVNLTGIIGEFNVPQLSIRSIADIE